MADSLSWEGNCLEPSAVKSSQTDPPPQQNLPTRPSRFASSVLLRDLRGSFPVARLRLQRVRRALASGHERAGDIFGDEHYSRAGNAIVADAVAKSLEAEPPKKVP
jgi:hypothetical protein